MCVCVREREREARRELEWSEEISRKFLQVLRATRESSRKILIEENSSKKSALVRNLGKEHSSKQHLPSRELILLRSMLVMSDMSDRSSARVNLPQFSRLTLSLPCFARMSLIMRIILPVKTPALE